MILDLQVTDPLPIGTNKECCHICYLLKDCLQDTMGTSTADVTMSFHTRC